MSNVTKKFSGIHAYILEFELYILFSVIEDL